MGNQLQALGYHATAYHNHLKDFYHRNNTHPHLGYDEFIARYGGLEITGSWPESDLEMIDVTVPQFIDKQPFSIYYMTVSGHCEYTFKGNDMTEKNWDKVQHLEHSDIVKGYYAANLEFEYAMESLLRQLEEAGIADDTLVVIATDHYPYGLERSKTWANTKDHLAELYGVETYDQFLRDHNALIMWSGAFEGMDIVVDTPVFSLDILPTVSNLFGVEWDSRLLVGRDVFSDAEPLVLWPDYNWVTDKGTFCDGEFTPRDGAVVDGSYVDRINAIVKNKITFSKSVVDMDYYDHVLTLMEQ
jgi:lipoteichoic acid synthase